MIAEPRGGSLGRLASVRRRLTVRALAIIALVVVILGCGWLWLRDSSLVRIRTVRVTGLSGPDVGQIRHALVSAATEMTTLDVNMARLDSAVSGYPVVRALRVATDFPHGAVIHVVEEVPVATVQVDGRRVFADAAGVLIAHPPEAVGALPSVFVRGAPVDDRVSTPGALAALRALGAAPYSLLPHLSNATSTAAHGIVVQVRHGPQLYFGSGTRLAAKWIAALSVLGSTGSQQADYIDVSDPYNPAAGAG